MRLGDVIESAIWLNGEETPEDRRRFESDVSQAITELCDDLGFLHGPVTFIEKHPDDDRVPPVPDHVQGQRVRLLVAEAPIVALKPEPTQDSFIANLDRTDLDRLRQMTREAHAKHIPGAKRLTDPEVDEVIEATGPEAALGALRQSRMH
jgi:hypothetical protein